MCDVRSLRTERKLKKFSFSEPRTRHSVSNVVELCKAISQVNGGRLEVMSKDGASGMGINCWASALQFPRMGSE